MKAFIKSIVILLDWLSRIVPIMMSMEDDVEPPTN